VASNLFSRSQASQAAGRRFLDRIRARTTDRDVPVSEATIGAHAAAVNIDHLAIRVNDVEAFTRVLHEDRRCGRPHIPAPTADGAAFSVGASDGSFFVMAGEPTQNIHVAFSGKHDDVRRFHADATRAG
jgi:hypothetical protein